MTIAIYLIIHVLFSLGMFISLKLISQKNADRYYSIFVNYVVAAILTFIDLSLSHSVWLFSANLILPSVIVAFLFVVTFIIMSFSAEKAGIGITTALNKMSVIIPVMAGIFFLGQTSHMVLKTSGLILSVIAFFLIFYKKNKKIEKGSIILPLMVFILSGLIDTSMEFSYIYYITKAFEREVFLLSLFLFAIGFSLVSAFVRDILLVRKGSKFFPAESRKIKIMPVLTYGSLLGIFNFLTSKMILINVGSLGGSVVYPIHNSSVVILTAFTGFLFFKERLSFKQWMGLFLAVAGVAVIASTL